LDFGLAAMTEATDSGPPPSLTTPGAAVGTVLYMSPEQALGDPLDPRTDIFSFGLVLYEMTTGRRAFDGRSTTAIVDSILHAAPPGLDPREVSMVPRDLRILLTRMLEKDREKRPATAAEVATCLRAVQRGSIAGREYAAAKPDSVPIPSARLTVGSDIYQTAPSYSPPTTASSGLSRAFANRNFGGVGAIAAAMVLLVIVGYFGVAWYRKPSVALASREPLLVADFVNTTGEAVFDGALKNALEIQLQQSPYLNIVPASQLHAALKLMQRPANEQITGPVAQDLCQRLGVKAIM